jgi:YfiH family protein
MTDLVKDHLVQQEGDLAWFQPLEPLAGIGHVVMTTRTGGLSREPYDSLNLGFHVGDVGERVRLNRRSVAKALGRRLLEPVVGEQVHGAHVRVVGELHAGTRWEKGEHALAKTDALITATRRLPLVTLVADCLPLALVDPSRQVGAVVHAGWRGLAGGVIENTVAAMRETWGCVNADLVAWLGPCIGACCYEVGPEVAAHFPYSTLPGEGDRRFLNLRAAAASKLAAVGLLQENLTGLDLCTACHPSVFFSHRRATTEGLESTGRQALILWLEKCPS